MKNYRVQKSRMRVSAIPQEDANHNTTSELVVISGVSYLGAVSSCQLLYQLDPVISLLFRSFIREPRKRMVVSKGIGLRFLFVVMLLL